MGKDYGLYGLTPLELRNSTAGPIWVKREDEYAFAGFSGAKVRACNALVKSAMERLPGLHTITTAGSRHSPQMAIVAAVAKFYGLSSVGYTSRGSRTPQVMTAESHGMTVIQGPSTYGQWASKASFIAGSQPGYYQVPFGMASREALDLAQVQLIQTIKLTFPNCPPPRIVMVCGSGVNLTGVLNGLFTLRLDIPVLGVSVGHDPTAYINKHALSVRRLTLAASPVPYKETLEADLDGLVLDYRYEAKAVPFLKSGDLFWVIGNSGFSS